MDLWNIGRKMHELLRSTAPYLQDLPAVSDASMGHLTRTQTFGLSRRRELAPAPPQDRVCA